MFIRAVNWYILCRVVDGGDGGDGGDVVKRLLRAWTRVVFREEYDHVARLSTGKHVIFVLGDRR